MGEFYFLSLEAYFALHELTNPSLLPRRPFVLTSQEAVRQTLLDFQMGINGFERAPGWKSKIGGRR